MKEFPTLKTKRLLLREFRPPDAAAVFDSFSREAVARYINRAPMQSVQDAEKLVSVRAALFERGIGIRWAIVLRENSVKLILIFLPAEANYA